MLNSLIRNISLWYIMSTKSLWGNIETAFNVYLQCRSETETEAKHDHGMEIGGVVLIYNKHAQLGAQLLTKETKL